MSEVPFGGMFGDIFNALGQQGPDAWFETAKQLALTVARGEDGDPNPDPPSRQRLEEVAPLVARHVDTILSVVTKSDVTATNRTGLTLAALEQWKPFIAPALDAPAPTAEDLDMTGAAAMAQIAATIGPLFTGFQLGSVAGHFSERAWSLAVLPLPRTSSERLLVVNNIAAFSEAWSLDVNAVTIFALAQEFVASVILTQPGTGDALRALLLDAVRDSLAVQGDLMTRLQSMVNPADLASLMGNPEQLLEGLEIPDETPAIRAINAATSVLSAVFDAAAHEVTEKILGPSPQLVEAYRRHRLTDARGEDAAGALFGISTQGEHHELAARFVATLQEEHTLSVFSALLRVDGLPTATELEDSHAWYERVTNSPLA